MVAAGPCIAYYTMSYSLNAIWNIADLGVIMNGTKEHSEFPQLNFSVAEQAENWKKNFAG
jgi:hypothetical protein